MHNLVHIWREVSSWSPELRLALATRLLQSLQNEKDEGPVPKERQEALHQLIGLWKTGQPPNDDQVEQILEQERKQKYG
jgi:hypothetical protein